MVTGWTQPWWIARPANRRLSRLCDRLVGGSLQCGLSADRRNAPTVPGSSHHHPAPVQPGPTPAASLAARAEQRPGVRREPSRCGGHAHSNFGQRANWKTHCRSPHPRRWWLAARRSRWRPLQQPVLARRPIERCPSARRPGSRPAVVHRGEVDAGDKSGRSIRLHYHPRWSRDLQTEPNRYFQFSGSAGHAGR